MPGKAASAFTDFMQDLVQDETSKRDSVEWAVVEQDSASAEITRPERKLYQNVKNTAWRLNDTLSSFCAIEGIKVTFTNYSNPNNFFNGFAVDGSTLSLVAPSGFDPSAFQLSVTGTLPIGTPSDWLNSGPIYFFDSPNSSNPTLIAWLLTNATLVEGELTKSQTTIESTYHSDDILADTTKYSVHLLSDQETRITGLLNQGPFSLNAGDYVMLYKIGGSLSNSYILGRKGSQSYVSQSTSRTSGVSRTATTTATTTTYPKSNVDIYSATFQSYGNSVSPWEHYYAFGHQSSVFPQAQGDIWYGAAKAEINGKDTAIGVWWPAGQLFDCTELFEPLYEAARSAYTVLGYYQNYYWNQAVYNKPEVMQGLQGLLDQLKKSTAPASDWDNNDQSVRDNNDQSVIWQMPQPGDELLLVRRSPYFAISAQPKLEFLVVSVVKQVWRTNT